MLPGTNRAADRFVRASFYVTNLPQTAEPKRAVAQIFSLIQLFQIKGMTRHTFNAEKICAAAGRNDKVIKIYFTIIFFPFNIIFIT